MNAANQSRTIQVEGSSKDPLSKDGPRYALVLIVIGAVLRILSFCYSANAGGDAWARLVLTSNWLKHPVFKIGYGAYPPGHFWLIGLFTLVFHNVVFAGRLLSLVLGIASLCAMWRLARNLYGETAGVAGLAIFVFYSLHIGYSTTSSAEVTYLFFLLSSLALFFGYIRDESRSLSRLALAGLFLSAAETIRLEAWAIFFGTDIILAVLEYQDQISQPSWFARWIKSILVFGLTAGAWPIFSMIYSEIVFHDPMRVLSQHNELITGWFKTHPVPVFYQLALGPGALLISLSPLAVAAALYGLWKSRASRLATAFALLMLFFAALQNYEIAAGKLLAMARYTMTLGAFLAVIAGFGCERFCAQFLAGRLRLAYALLIAFLVVNLGIVFFLSEYPNRFSSKIASVSPRLRYSPHILGPAHYLRTHMAADDTVVIDNYNEESNVIGQVAGLPLDPGSRAFLANTSYDETVDQYIVRLQPRFVVYSDQGTLRRWLNLPSGCGTAMIEGMDYQCVLANPIYRVYQRVEPAKN